MTTRLSILACTLCSAALLAACGTSNSARTVETVTVTNPDTSTAQTTTLPQTATTAPPTTSSGASKTRTAPAPSFTGGTASGTNAGGPLSSAVAKVRAVGFAPLGTATYDSKQTLRVLLGTRSGTGSGGRQVQAFFFNGSRYLGTDTRSPSAQIHVAGQSDTAVTLSYGISTGGTRNVRFQLDMGRLMAVDVIPSAAERR